MLMGSSMLFALLVKQSMGLAPQPPKWLPDKGFRTSDETRYVLKYEWTGMHTCDNANDPFPSEACLDKSNENFKLNPRPEKCMKCENVAQGTWAATFCSANPEADDTVWTQYVEYTDDQCQSVNQWNFSSQVENWPTRPKRCGAYVDCKAECFGYPGGRGHRGCGHIHGKDKAACDQDSLCHWNEPPMNISFLSSYVTLGDVPHTYVCFDNRCEFSLTNGSSLAACEQVCKPPIVV